MPLNGITFCDKTELKRIHAIEARIIEDLVSRNIDLAIALARAYCKDELKYEKNGLVGPRPIVQAEVTRYGKYIKEYYSVLPGITGMWQTSGRSDIDYPERVQMDSWYVHNWSVWLDMVLLWRTVAVVLSHKGAY